jgi:hypothetical protein
MLVPEFMAILSLSEARKEFLSYHPLGENVSRPYVLKIRKVFVIPLVSERKEIQRI